MLFCGGTGFARVFFPVGSIEINSEIRYVGCNEKSDVPFRSPGRIAEPQSNMAYLVNALFRTDGTRLRRLRFFFYRLRINGNCVLKSN